MQPKPKQSYHPFILIAFYLNFLPPEILSQIPRTTRHEWQHKSVAQLFGYDWFSANRHLFDTLQAVSVNRKLMKINKALLRVIALKNFMKTHAAVTKEWPNYSETILTNIAKIRCVLGFQAALKWAGISKYEHRKLHVRKRCSKSILNFCLPKHPTQLLSKEVAVIKNYCSDIRFLHWPLVSVFHQIIRDKAAHFCKSTFYRYAGLLNMRRRNTLKRRKNHSIGIRADKPLQLLHTDVTVFRTMDNVKAFIHLVQDNFSRSILNHSVSLECKAITTKRILKEVHEAYLCSSGLETCLWMTDDGSENFGKAKQFVKEVHNPGIQHIIAQHDVVYSNSMIEAANKNIKYHFLYHKEIADFRALCDYVAKAVEDYNNRPHNILSGLTPLEVLNGKQLDKKRCITKLPKQKQQEYRLTKMNCVVHTAFKQ